MDNYFNITKVVSPAIFGGEYKNQDRAGYSSPTFTACLCDGVSTSPNAAKAAEFCVHFSSVLFDNDPAMQLETLAKILTNHRNASVHSGINITNQSDAMQLIMQEAAKEKLKHSFQTTLVATQLLPQKQHVSAKFISCGDSGIFVYDPTGQLLYSNLDSAYQSTGNKIPFGPEHKILTRIIGSLADNPNLARQTNITNGFICEVISTIGNPLSHENTRWLKKGEHLIVPSHLITPFKEPECRNLATVIYSRFIQKVNSPLNTTATVNLTESGNATAVLPDHFYSGNWNYEEDEFPQDVSCLLCSDGFYRCFKTPLMMWHFLKRHEYSQKKESWNQRLHQKLSNTFGDDDISFIWISPQKRSRPCLQKS